MIADDARNLLLSMDHATEETPFGPDVLVYKVGGKMYATLAFDGESPRINLKCNPLRSPELRTDFEGIVPGYHMNKRHWNTVVLDSDVPDALVKELSKHSWDLVYRSLPRKVRAKF